MNLQPAHTAFLFPGQGSQAVGMGQDLANRYPAAKDIFAEADELLGFSLSQLAWEGPENELNDTINTQAALFVHSAAALKVFRDLYPDFQPALVAGHSMGELSALHAAGSLSLSEGLRLVRMRGVIMKKAGEIHPGGMAAVLGLDIPTLDQICAEATRRARENEPTDDEQFQVVQVANDNSIGQVVISGSKPALELALGLAQEAGARRTIPLAVSIAAHSPLMTPAQAEFTRAVEAAQMVSPQIPVIGNVTASPLSTIEQVQADLQDQLTHRVRWTETIQNMRSQGITHFVELGSGSVLTGLLKRIDRGAIGLAMGKPEDYAQAAE